MVKTSKLISKVRRDKGISQEDIALRLGMTRQRYSRFESGQAGITTKQLDKLFYLLGLKPIDKND